MRWINAISVAVALVTYFLAPSASASGSLTDRAKECQTRVAEFLPADTKSAPPSGSAYDVWAHIFAGAWEGRYGYICTALVVTAISPDSDGANIEVLYAYDHTEFDGTYHGSPIKNLFHASGQAAGPNSLSVILGSGASAEYHVVGDHLVGTWRGTGNSTSNVGGLPVEIQGELWPVPVSP